MPDISAIDGSSTADQNTTADSASDQFSAAINKAKSENSGTDSGFDSKFNDMLIQAGTSFGANILLPQIKQSTKPS